MGALREVEDLLPSLTRAEKAQLLRAVVQDLDDAFPGVESTPGVSGGEPCIVRIRIPVGCLSRHGVWESVKKIYCARTRPCAPKTLPARGHTFVPTDPKSRTRSAITKARDGSPLRQR